MSARDRATADHDRARQLAAARVDDALAPGDEAWLADHLDACDECAAAAADYDAQHDLFAGLRAVAPDPPRDLWARTASAIDAERGRRSTGWRRLRGTPRVSRRVSLVPLVAVVAVVVVVSAGLLNGRPLPGGPAGPTPIALSAADVQVLGRDSAGNVQIMTRQVDQVCPVGVTTCGVSPTFAVTAVSGLGQASTLQGALSPARDRLVVVAGNAAGEGVYVLPVGPSGSAAPSSAGSAATPALASPAPATSAIASSASASSAPATADASATPAAASSAETSAPSVAIPSDTPAASPSQPTTPSDSASAAPSASSSAEPSSPGSTTPSAGATPASDAAIQIASGVTVVGAPLYAPDGSHLAFSAMPTNGSTGPDVYVWSTGDKSATMITSDHGSWLSAWTASGILVSRVTDGTPSSFLLDPATGSATAVGTPGTWLPSVAPSGAVAVWWSGTVKLAADGVTWLPDAGKVVLGAWPSTQGADGAPAPQAVSKGQVAAWQSRWDETSDAVAIWIDPSANDHSGKLSLYQVDPATGAVNLSSPMLDGVAANPDFSLRTGRLAWTTPSSTAPQTVEVLAWSGKDIGRLELPADGSGTVVP